METPNIPKVHLPQSAFIKEQVIKQLDKLPYNEYLTLLFDHDPISLYYELQQNRKGEFHWKYLESGPDAWVVKIINIAKDYRSVADILFQYPTATSVFERHNIDYFCKGSSLLNEACDEAGVNPNEVLREIEESEKNPHFYERANNWPIDFLIEYISVNDHQYLREKKKVIIRLLAHISDIHGETRPELFNINLIFNKLAEALRQSLQMEEKLLFPAVKSFMNTEEPKDLYPVRSFEDFIKALTTEHFKIGKGIRRIRNMTKNYSLSESSDGKFKLLYAMLRDFEKEFRLHVLLENTILFPKSLAMKQELC